MLPVGVLSLPISNGTDIVPVVAVGWEALLLYDLLLFGMTLAKAYQARYQLGPRHIRGMSLISVIIRDGKDSLFRPADLHSDQWRMHQERYTLRKSYVYCAVLFEVNRYVLCGSIMSLVNFVNVFTFYVSSSYSSTAAAVQINPPLGDWGM